MTPPAHPKKVPIVVVVGNIVIVNGHPIVSPIVSPLPKATRRRARP
jgi:hypothetical protein